METLALADFDRQAWLLDVFSRRTAGQVQNTMPRPKAPTPKSSTTAPAR